MHSNSLKSKVQEWNSSGELTGGYSSNKTTPNRFPDHNWKGLIKLFHIILQVGLSVKNTVKLQQENHGAERGSSLMEVRVQPTCRACFFAEVVQSVAEVLFPAAREQNQFLQCAAEQPYTVECDITDMKKVINFAKKWVPLSSLLTINSSSTSSFMHYK